MYMHCINYSALYKCKSLLFCSQSNTGPLSATTDTANEHNHYLVVWGGDCGPLLWSVVTLSQLPKLPKH